MNAPSSWYTAYTTSEGGINWDKHGLVIDEAYLYAIRENVNIGIYTSQDGVEWEYRKTILMGVHRHIAGTYVERTNDFHFYTSCGFAGVSQSISSNGVHFGPFRQVMEPSNVGLDDWQDAGVTLF